jgi:uncharacterized protein
MSYMQAYQKNYCTNHEVVKAKDIKYFRFFPIDSNYNVLGSFEKITDTIGFTMKTSGAVVQQYYKYGKLSFQIHDTLLRLFIYQSKKMMDSDEYKGYLFIPFTDLTTGDESYGSGRYIDATIPQIINNQLVIDFNKAYNPYCAYSTGYHCPIPPGENHLPIAIRAGEKVFGRGH